MICHRCGKAEGKEYRTDPDVASLCLCDGCKEIAIWVDIFDGETEHWACRNGGKLKRRKKAAATG